MANFIIIGQLEMDFDSKHYCVAAGYELNQVVTDVNKQEPKLSTRVYIYNEDKKDGELVKEEDLSVQLREISYIYLKGISDGAAYSLYLASIPAESEDKLITN